MSKAERQKKSRPATPEQDGVTGHQPAEGQQSQGQHPDAADEGQASLVLLDRDPSLPERAEKIRYHIREAEKSITSWAMHARSAGDELLAVQQQLKHGQFKPWVQANFELSESTARLYMRIARRWSDDIIRQSGNDVTTLSLSRARDLLADPDAHRKPAAHFVHDESRLKRKRYDGPPSQDFKIPGAGVTLLREALADHLEYLQVGGINEAWLEPDLSAVALTHDGQLAVRLPPFEPEALVRPIGMTNLKLLIAALRSTAHETNHAKIVDDSECLVVVGEDWRIHVRASDVIATEIRTERVDKWAARVSTQPLIPITASMVRHVIGAQRLLKVETATISVGPNESGEVTVGNVAADHVSIPFRAPGYTTEIEAIVNSALLADVLNRVGMNGQMMISPEGVVGFEAGNEGQRYRYLLSGMEPA